ncbi:MAG: DUF2892 domain-containing protein [Spirochaetes bacterium]|nr:MAG: DUF2892 domain-containing protein [Spirochaetota bacterium]
MSMSACAMQLHDAAIVARGTPATGTYKAAFDEQMKTYADRMETMQTARSTRPAARGTPGWTVAGRKCTCGKSPCFQLFVPALVDKYHPAKGVIDMTMNVGPADKYIRILVGIGLLLQIIILSPGWLGTLALLVAGGAMFFTAIGGFCWPYKLLRITSCAAPKAPDAGTQAHGH